MEHLASKEGVFLWQLTLVGHTATVIENGILLLIHFARLSFQELESL
jgi:hypothetical protein